MSEYNTLCSSINLKIEKAQFLLSYSEALIKSKGY